MKALSISIHMDDSETMGGTLSLLAKRGVDVTILNIKPYMHHIGGIPEANAQSMKAAEVLGAKKIILDYSGTRYYKCNEKTVRMTEEVIRDINPDIVFVMHPRDNHIEHVECARTAREALFAAAVDHIVPNEIYSYESGAKQSMCYFTPDLYIDVSSELAELEACDKVFNQKHADGNHLWDMRQRYIKFRASECGLDYAEGLKIIKNPNLNNDFFLRQILEDKFRWGGNGMYWPESELFR